MANRGWNFLKEHNPVWAARVFNRGVRRASAALPRPVWRRGRPELTRHASAVSVHMRNAWRNRPSMPRPHYRLKTRTVETSAHMAYIDVAAFYILAVIHRLCAPLRLGGSCMHAGGIWVGTRSQATEHKACTDLDIEAHHIESCQSSFAGLQHPEALHLQILP